MDKKLKILYSEAQIKEKIIVVSKRIKAQYSSGEKLICVCVLKGAVMFFADLMKELEGYNVVYDFLTVSSYGSGTVSSGKARLLDEPKENPLGQNVLIVEDIIDSGITLEFLIEYYKNLKAKDVKVAALVDKPCARKAAVKPDFCAFSLEGSPYIVGYGLDADQRFRNLKSICIMETN